MRAPHLWLLHPNRLLRRRYARALAPRSRGCHVLIFRKIKQTLRNRRVVGKYFERDKKILLGQRFELLVGQLLLKLHTRELNHVNRRDVINGLDATSKQIEKNRLTNRINILGKKHRKLDSVVVGRTYEMVHADNALVNLKKVVANVVRWHRLEVLLQREVQSPKKGRRDD